VSIAIRGVTTQAKTSAAMPSIKLASGLRNDN
jgi:hypothetical protein